MTTTPFVGRCAVCGARIQSNTGTWRHSRPQPDGSPHDHKAGFPSAGSPVHTSSRRNAIARLVALAPSFTLALAIDTANQLLDDEEVTSMSKSDRTCPYCGYTFETETDREAHIPCPEPTSDPRPTGFRTAT